MNPLIVKHKRLIMVGGVALVVLGLAGLRWRMSYASAKKSQAAATNATANAALAVRAFKCKMDRFVDNLVMTGTLQGGARVELRFDREGRISKLNYRIGDKVRKGAVIAELDTEEARLRLQQAELELSQTVDLFRTGAIAKPRLTQVRVAAELARKEFNRSFIRAPRDGSIGEVNIEVGEHVTSQVTVASLVSVDTVFVEMGVIEKELGKLHRDQQVTVEVETYPGVVFEGRITHIAPIVEGTSRTRTVRAEIPNPKGLLLPGMFARSRIFILEKPNVLVVPATAVRREKDKALVFLIRENNKLAAAPIQTGYESADFLEVQSGLEAGARVVANVTDEMKEGKTVEVVEETEYATDKTTEPAS